MDYGRSIEGLIQHAKTIEDREQRNLAAQTIVEMMSRVVPRSRENAGWKRRMWDHMMVLADWELDVDWPVWAGRKPETKPIDELKMAPRRLEYKIGRIRHRHYGRGIEKMVETAKNMPNSAERDELIRQLIDAMKNSYSNWNTSTVSQDVIYKQLYEMSDGKLDHRALKPNTAAAADNPDQTINVTTSEQKTEETDE